MDEEVQYFCKHGSPYLLKSKNPYKHRIPTRFITLLKSTSYKFENKINHGGI